MEARLALSKDSKRRWTLWLGMIQVISPPSEWSRKMLKAKPVIWRVGPRAFVLLPGCAFNLRQKVCLNCLFFRECLSYTVWTDTRAASQHNANSSPATDADTDTNVHINLSAALLWPFCSFVCFLFFLPLGSQWSVEALHTAKDYHSGSTCQYLKTIVDY